MTAAAAADLVTPLRRARLAVVLNASDFDHFAVSGERSFRAACPPWTAPPVFVADHDIAERLVPMLEAGEVDAVVFASNALNSASAQKAVKERSFVKLWGRDGAASDVGVLVLHQYLGRGTRLPLDFLDGAALTLVGQQPRGVDRGAIRFQREWLFAAETSYEDRAGRFLALSDGYGPERFCLWASAEPRHPEPWERLVWEHDGEDLICACAAGARVVIASRIPLDLMGSTELLGSFIAACLRPRGCLLVQAPGTVGSTAFTPALASAIERGRFVWHVCPETAAEIDPTAAPYHFFDELIVAPEWRIADLDAFEQRSLLRKLEQGGSIVATFDGPRGSRVAVRLSGQPQYAARARALAAWLLPRLDGFKVDLWAARGLSDAVVATREAFVDDRLIPQALQQAFVRRHVGEQLAADRVHGDNVDDNVLVTLGMYAIARNLGMPGYERLREWAAEKLDRELPSVVAQALVLAPELATEQRLRRIREAVAAGDDSRDDAKLLRAYAAVLFAAEDPGAVAAAADPTVGLGVQAELLRAVVRHDVSVDDAIVGLAALVRERIDRLAVGWGGLEAVCLGNAALIELARRQGVGPSAAVRERARELDSRTVENTELVRAKEDALRDAAEARRIGRQWTTVLVGALALVTVAGVVAGFVALEQPFERRVGFALTVFGALSSLTLYVLKKARAAGLPPWPLRS